MRVTVTPDQIRTAFEAVKDEFAALHEDPDAAEQRAQLLRPAG